MQVVTEWDPETGSGAGLDFNAPVIGFGYGPLPGWELIVSTPATRRILAKREERIAIVDKVAVLSKEAWKRDRVTLSRGG